MIIGDSWIVTAINTFLGMPFGLGYVVHYMMAIKSTAECSAVYHVFSFRFHKNKTALRSFPGAKILSRILIRQTLPFRQCIQILARSTSRRTDDAHLRIGL